MQLLAPSSWGPSTHGVPVVINEQPISLNNIVAIDIETDEADHFVGGAIYDGGKLIYYYTSATDFVAQLVGKKLIGFNVKADLNWLRMMGHKVQSSDIYADPMIMSYVVNANRESQTLKDIAADVLKWHWPTYREMVGKGRAKQTLDKQDIERVAEYCGMDTLAAWKLYEHFNRTFNKCQRDLYENLELPVYRMLWDMEQTGIQIDLAKLEQLDKDFGAEVIQKGARLRAYSLSWNPNSPQQTLKVLADNGIHVPKTDKPTLLPHIKHPLVADLLAYRKVMKLHSTYVTAFKALTSLPLIHTTFNQVAYDSESGDMRGIRTGRLSSNNPNLQNIPSKKKGETYGERLRELFIPRNGKTFIDADYSQIEYRLLAHFSQEPSLVKGFHAGADVHEITGKLLVPNHPDFRKIGKTLNFASIYGAQAGKISATAGVTELEAQTFLDKYWEVLPQVRRWVDRTKILARSRGGVQTMSGRWIPLPDLASKNKWKRMHAERAAVNYIIQGSAADIIKVAMLELNKAGFFPLIQVHDELIFEVDPANAKADLAKIKAIMEKVVSLSVPIIADAHIGNNWQEAKGD